MKYLFFIYKFVIKLNNISKFQPLDVVGRDS